MHAPGLFEVSWPHAAPRYGNRHLAAGMCGRADDRLRAEHPQHISKSRFHGYVADREPGGSRRPRCANACSTDLVHLSEPTVLLKRWTISISTADGVPGLGAGGSECRHSGLPIERI